MNSSYTEKCKTTTNRCRHFTPAAAPVKEKALAVNAVRMFAAGQLKYGETNWSPKASAIFPKLEIDWSASGKQWTGKVKQTSAAMGAVIMTFLAPGVYKIPGKLVKANDPQCGKQGKMVPFFTTVDAAMSDIAKKAEQEHKSDYQRAYDLTLKKWADIINAVAASGQTFGPDTKPKVESDIKKLLTQKGNKTRNQWIAELNRLNALSKQRDINKWHALKSDGPPVTIAPDCSKVTGTTVLAATTQVPGPTSAALIN
jgi:hypothetical protein